MQHLFQNCGSDATQCTLENEGKVEEKPQKSETKCYRCFIADLPLVTSALAQTYLLVAIYPKQSVQSYLFKTSPFTLGSASHRWPISLSSP
jgi:hypothetical protein